MTRGDSRPEFTGYLTSDRPMGDVCKKLNQILKIDAIAAANSDLYDDATRPDLVFVAANSANPDHVMVVELKSPGIPLENNHLTQLEEYMMKVEAQVELDFRKKIRIDGYLIGTKPKPDSKAVGQQMLIKKIREATPNTQYQVTGISELLANAKIVHMAAIDALQKEEQELSEDLS